MKVTSVIYLRLVTACVLLFLGQVCFAQEDAGTRSTTFNNHIKEYFESLKSGDVQTTKGLLDTFYNISSSQKFSKKERLIASIKTAYINLTKRNYKEVLNITERVRSQYPDLIDSNLLLELDYYDLYTQVQLNKKHNDAAMERFLLKHARPFDQNSFTYALSLEFTGRYYQDKSKYENSLQSFKKAIEIFEENGYLMHQGIAYSGLGATYDLMEDFDSAATAYAKSIEYSLALTTINYDALAGSSYNLSLLYGDRLGNYKKALKYAKKAAEYDELARGDENPYLALDYKRISATYFSTNDYNKSLLYAEKAVQHARKYFNKQPNRYSECLRQLSRSYTALGRKDEAIQASKEALGLLDGLVPENHRWYCASYVQMANMYLDLGMIEEAEVFFLKAQKIAIAINRDLFQIDINQKLGDIYLKRNQPDKAKQYIDANTLLIAEKFKDALYFKQLNSCANIQFLIQKKQLKEATNKLDTLRETTLAVNPDVLIRSQALDVLSQEIPAIESCEQFIQTLSDTKNRFPNAINKIVYAREVKWLIASVLNKIYPILGNHPEYVDVFFQLVEINKNAVLLESIQNVRLKEIAGIPNHIVEKDLQLADSIQRMDQQITKIINNTATVKNASFSKLLDRQLALTKESDRLQQTIKKEYPKLHTLKSLALTKTLSSFQKERLRENDAVIEYFIFGDQGYSLLITKKNIDVQSFKAGSKLTEDVQTLVKSIKDRSYNRALARDFTTLYVPKNIPENVDRLIIITDGLLNLIPFEALLLDNDFLLKSYEISYAGSLQLLQEQMKLPRTGKNWVGYAPTYTNNELGKNLDEVTQINELQKGKAFTGASATKDSFINNSADFDIIHLATHTEIDQTNPAQNRLLFYGEGEEQSLFASEIYGIKLNASLAVLSACNTGYGKIESGEGVMSLSRAFAYAGVGSTLMSLWKIPDNESFLITRGFYKNLDNKLSKTTALRQSKLSYLAATSDKVLQEPYYWAGLVLSGDMSPVTSTTPVWVFIVGVSFLIFFLALFMLSRKRKKTSQLS